MVFRDIKTSLVTKGSHHQTNLAINMVAVLHEIRTSLTIKGSYHGMKLAVKMIEDELLVVFISNAL